MTPDSRNAPSLTITVQRSRRRRRTISWEVRHEHLVITVPAALSPSDERAWVDKIRSKVERRLSRAARKTDTGLWARAQSLWSSHFDGPCPATSVVWSDRQQRVHGSCSTATGEIRISRRLAQFPPWVLDYILVHELAHLIEANHGERFWALVRRYPETDRARGFLEACDMGYSGSLAGWLDQEPA